MRPPAHRIPHEIVCQKQPEFNRDNDSEANQDTQDLRLLFVELIKISLLFSRFPLSFEAILRNAQACSPSAQGKAVSGHCSRPETENGPAKLRLLLDYSGSFAQEKSISLVRLGRRLEARLDIDEGGISGTFLTVL